MGGAIGSVAAAAGQELAGAKLIYRLEL